MPPHRECRHHCYNHQFTKPALPLVLHRITNSKQSHLSVASITVTITNSQNTRFLPIHQSGLVLESSLTKTPNGILVLQEPTILGTFLELTHLKTQMLETLCWRSMPGLGWGHLPEIHLSVMWLPSVPCQGQRCSVPPSQSAPPNALCEKRDNPDFKVRTQN